MTDVRPTRDEHALVELLDVLLEKGVVIQADIVVTVADIPLIGISLRAAIAGMTTMSEYGLFAESDRRAPASGTAATDGAVEEDP
ncbi:MAG: gas vesicle protein GvpM [Haloglomus sp.]